MMITNTGILEALCFYFAITNIAQILLTMAVLKEINRTAYGRTKGQLNRTPMPVPRGGGTVPNIDPSYHTPQQMSTPNLTTTESNGG